MTVPEEVEIEKNDKGDAEKKEAYAGNDTGRQNYAHNSFSDSLPAAIHAEDLNPL